MELKAHITVESMLLRRPGRLPGLQSQRHSIDGGWPH